MTRVYAISRGCDEYYTGQNRRREAMPGENTEGTLFDLFISKIPVEVRDRRGDIVASMALNEGSIVLDTNVVLAWKKALYGSPRTLDRKAYERLREVISPPDRIFSDKEMRYLGNSRVFLPDMVLRELSIWDDSASRLHYKIPPGSQRVTLLIDRRETRYRDMMRKMESLRVGGNDGLSDRIMMTDIMFSSNNGGVPIFITADSEIFGPLCKISPNCKIVETFVRNNKTRYIVDKKSMQGFDVTIRDSSGVDHVLHIIPV